MSRPALDYAGRRWPTAAYFGRSQDGLLRWVSRESDRMVKQIYLLGLGLVLSLAAVAGTTDPAGPSSWTLRNWAGFILQTALFVATVYLLYRLAARQEREFDETGTEPEPPVGKRK